MPAPDVYPTTPLQVVILSGGDSAERAVSLKSGQAVAEALAANGHHVRIVDPAEVELEKYDWTGVDAAFIALHGRFGEDGQVQKLLEDLRIPYTGSGVQASRLAFSKSAAKERLLLHHVPTPSYVLIHESDTAQRILHNARSLGFPLVVKPDTQGSSLGVSILGSEDDLPKALTRCFHLDSFGLLESAISGTEWTVGLLDDLVLPPIQIETNRNFFDFTAKYEDDDTRYRFDYSVAPETVQLIAQTAKQACAALGTSGLARVDLMLDRYLQPWVLEINTVPGFTDHSLVPKAAVRHGLTPAELYERSLVSALRTWRNTHPLSPHGKAHANFTSGSQVAGRQPDTAKS